MWLIRLLFAALFVSITRRGSEESRLWISVSGTSTDSRESGSENLQARDAGVVDLHAHAEARKLDIIRTREKSRFRAVFPLQQQRASFIMH